MGRKWSSGAAQGCCWAPDSGRRNGACARAQGILGAMAAGRSWGSAYSWAASMEKKPLRREVVEQEMVAGFLLPENKGRASVAGALGRRGWSFGC
jgi:hypothetical protein